MPGIKEISVGRSDLYKVKFHDLHIKDGWNSRDYDAPENVEHVKTLAASIAAEGVKEPLAGWMEDGKIFVENGHMRHRAIAYAIEHLELNGEELQIPIQITPKDLTDADRLLSQITRNSGKSLAPLEMAALFEKLKKADPEMTDAEIARRAGITRVYVGSLIELAKQPKSVTKYVRSGEVAATLAIDVIKKAKGNPKKAAELLKLAVEAAKAIGKTRATAKHLPKAAGEEDNKKPNEPAGKDNGGGEGNEGGEEAAPRKKSALSQLDDVKALVNEATVEEDGDDVLVVFTKDEYAKFAALLGLKTLGEKIDDAANGGDEEGADAGEDNSGDEGSEEETATDDNGI